MRTVGLVIIILIAGILEGLSQPWLSVFGVSLPLTILVIAFLGNLMTQTAKLPWFGLLGGALLDVASYNPLGSQALYMFLLAWFLHRIAENETNIAARGWRQLVVVVLATLIRPVYLSLLNHQTSQNWEVIVFISLIQAIFVSLVAGISLLPQARKNQV